MGQSPWFISLFPLFDPDTFGSLPVFIFCLIAF